MMAADITSREDIQLLVESFYKRVREDEMLAPIFRDLTHFRWDTHIPVMVSFWETVLLGASSYAGNPMQKHITLHRDHPLSEKHFDRWRNLFFATLDELFSGPVTNDAKQRVFSMETLMLFKLNASDKEGFIQ